MTKTLTPMQLLLARKALRWSSRDLAKRASVGSATIERYERGRTKPISATVAAMRQALEDGGIEFIDDNGLRLKRAG